MKPESLGNSLEFRNTLKELRQIIENNKVLSDSFNKCIKHSDYEILKNCVIELDYEISFAVSSMSQLTYDLKGNIIIGTDDLVKPHMKNLFITIFPDNNKSFILLSWLNEEFYNQFIPELLEIFEFDKGEFFIIMNNLLTQTVDNFAISPSLIKKWTEIQKKEFLKANKSSMFLEGNEIIKNLRKQYFDFDLFEKV